ncbi:MAG: energy-coupled thiamine transporter ThiT [Clostridia bacterium]|nr:energy-coupled thiamine transporter ThiT [Clostridia bacterium]
MIAWLSTALAEEAETATELVEAPPSWVYTVFHKLGELPAWGWILIVVFLLGGLLLFRNSRSNTKKTIWTTKMLSLGAMCMALSVVLSRIRLFTMPNGGSITPASMLPLMLFAYVYGTVPGLTLGALFGLLDYAFGGWFLSVPQFLLDYPVAFGLLGLAGLARSIRNDKVGLPLGAVIGSFGRYAAAVLAGVVFWADTRTGWEAWSYSLIYNGTYMSIECVLCVLITILVGDRLLKAIRQVK